MSQRPLWFLSIACGIVLFTACAKCDTITAKPLTLDELAAVLGVEATCLDAHFDTPCYARLVANITDETGHHREESPVATASTDFHVRVLLLKDLNTGSYRFTYSIMRLADHDYGHLVEDGGCERYISLDPGYGLQRKTFGNQAGKFSCALSFTSSKTRHLADRDTTVEGPSKEILIELETSATPFPAAAPSLSDKPPGTRPTDPAQAR